jgi:hypothetical protein
MSDYYPKARSSELVIQTVGDETLVYDLNSNEAHCLNETAALVWSKCNGRLSIDDISKSFDEQNDRSTAAHLAQLAISQLSERGLLSEPAPEILFGINRRQMLRRIGAASVIAVPLIASIVAPPRALGSISCFCISSAQCLTDPSCVGTFCNELGTCAPNAPGPSPNVSYSQSS